MTTAPSDQPAAAAGGDSDHSGQDEAQPPPRTTGEDAPAWLGWQESLGDLAQQVGALGNQVLTQMQDQLARLSDAQVRLAVTGLSGSGKTVFTLALVHLLKHSRDDPELLIKLGIKELVSVRLAPAPIPDTTRFPYDSRIAALSTAHPSWPESTGGVSALRIQLRYRPVKTAFFSLGNGVEQLTLDLVDYPGEWLMDLPLLSTSFSAWSAHSLALMAAPPRATLAAAWRDSVARLDPDAPAADHPALIRQAAARYHAYLRACRSAGLHYLQPGRFVLPGELAGTPLLEFFPVATPGPAPPGSLHAALEQRYQAYLEQVVQPFYRTYFATFDRQVVLVDLLSVLNTGYHAFTDTRAALTDLLRQFRYGDNTWINRLFAPRIDRVIFAATQADRVSRNQAPLLAHLLQSMLGDPDEDIRHQGDDITIHYQALSALCCTQDMKCTLQGRPATCIRGTPLAGGDPITCFPGQVPSLPPHAADWEGYAFPQFRPRPGRYEHGERLDQLRMYGVLRQLIGDKL